MNTDQTLQARLTNKIAEIDAVLALFAENYSVERMAGQYVPSHIVQAVNTLKAQREVLEEVLA